MKKKKILICFMIVTFLATGCGKVAQLENGQDAVVTLSSGDISVDKLYEESLNKNSENDDFLTKIHRLFLCRRSVC